MSAARLLRQARAAGLKLAVSPAGKLKCRGPVPVLERLKPALALHRDALLAALRAERDAVVVTVPAGDDAFEAAAELIRMAREKATPGRSYRFRLVDQRAADRRNAEAVRTHSTDRYCGCGALATFAWPDDDGREVWRLSEHYCEVWCESRSIASVIQKDCNELAVSLYPCGGFSSISFVHDAVEEINARKDQKPVTVFYIGDYDPAGVLIDVALEREMRLHLKDGVDFRFVRLGITEEQIRQYDLPEKPRKTTDKRAIHIARTVEAEAMPAGVLRQILRNAVEGLLPPDALKVCRVAEESERSRLVQLAEEYELRWYWEDRGQ
jgi:hypothetical protein